MRFLQLHFLIFAEYLFVVTSKIRLQWSSLRHYAIQGLCQLALSHKHFIQNFWSIGHFQALLRETILCLHPCFERNLTQPLNWIYYFIV